jgi:hypothetical protein
MVFFAISQLGSVITIEQLSKVKILGIIKDVVFHHQVLDINAKCSKLFFSDNLQLFPSISNQLFLEFKNCLISFFDRNSAFLFNFFFFGHKKINLIMENIVFIIKN